MRDRIKFASQARPEVLDAMKEVAQEEGRQFQAVVEDAFVFFLEHHKQGKVRSSVLTHFQASVAKNRRLAELLAR
jgi:hypothetical protein